METSRKFVKSNDSSAKMSYFVGFDEKSSENNSKEIVQTWIFQFDERNHIFIDFYPEMSHQPCYLFTGRKSPKVQV